MPKVAILILSILISVNCFAQTDTARCVILVTNLRKCTTKHVRAYEVTRLNEQSQEWDHVKFLNERFKPFRERRNRCIVFYESSM